VAVKVSVQQFGIFQHHSSSMAASTTQSWHQFDINLSVTDDCIVDGIAKNLAFFVREMQYIRYFQPNRVSNPIHWWNSPVNRTMQGHRLTQLLQYTSVIFMMTKF